VKKRWEPSESAHLRAEQAIASAFGACEVHIHAASGEASICLGKLSEGGEVWIRLPVAVWVKPPKLSMELEDDR
jgi:hypothetical protein